MKGIINERIAFSRRLLGYNQKYVAERLCMKLSTYCQAERKSTITCGFLMKVSQILGVSTDYLLYGGDKPTYFHNEYVVSLREKKLITAIRNMPEETKKEVYAFIQSVYRNKGRIDR